MSIKIIVSTCDKFSPLWPVFLFSIRRHAPWLESNIVVVSAGNRITMMVKLMKFKGMVVAPERDGGFNKNVTYAISLLPPTVSCICTWMDDRILTKNIDRGEFLRAINYIESGRADYIKLTSGAPIGKGVDCGSNLFGPVMEGSRYLLSLTIACWRRDFLLSALEKCETPWDVEFRAKALVGLLGHKGRIFGISRGKQGEALIANVHIVVRGKMIRSPVPTRGYYYRMLVNSFGFDGLGRVKNIISCLRSAVAHKKLLIYD